MYLFLGYAGGQDVSKLKAESISLIVDVSAHTDKILERDWTLPENSHWQGTRFESYT
jgi:hypothetical protein